AGAQRSDVLQVLASLGLEHLADEGRLIEFWNKLDLLSGDAREVIGAAAVRQPDVLLGSARTGQGIDGLLAELDRRLAAGARVLELDLDTADGARLAWLYRHGNVLARSEANGRIRLRVALPPAQQRQLASWLPPEASG
ncbi:MAG: hflX, partial [Geminicoccaceae bacterium]|nr:hflX [Geminicoccaceae bacterium]